MATEVIVTDEFTAWYEGLSEAEQDRVAFTVGLLEMRGVTLPFPHSSAIQGASFALRELRTQAEGDPLRTLYAFDPSRQAVLLIGGDKTGDDRFLRTHDPRRGEDLARLPRGDRAEEAPEEVTPGPGDPGTFRSCIMATHKWSEIKSRMSPDRKARVDAAVRLELLTMELRELRQEAGKTQAEVAEIAEMTQAELSKFERREDHLLSTLRRYVTALGGELEVVAVFDNKRIALKGV